MKVLVTGSSGYLGLHLVNLLTSLGYSVVGIDRKEPPKNFGPKYQHISMKVEDIWDFIPGRNEISAVVHLAAEKSVVESFRIPNEYLLQNTLLVERIVSWSNYYGIKKFTFASSAAVYGDAEIAAEDSKIRPLSPYGHSKLLAEQLLEYYNLYQETNVQIFRIFNLAGISDGLCGIIDPMSLGGIQSALVRSYRGNKKFKVNLAGNITADGSCERDFIHPIDVCLAIEKSLVTNLKFPIINLGTGVPTSVLSILEIYQDLQNIELLISSSPPIAGEISRAFSATLRANSIDGWTPRHSTMENILQNLI
jgi:UDP-glucose 4-epimerase